MAARILIVYESKNGQTMKIAKFICDRLNQKGHSVELMSMNHLLPVTLSAYDGIIVGAPIYMRSYSRRLRKWIQQHAVDLNKKNSAFFSVCMQAMDRNESSQRDLLKLSEDFFARTGWYPKRRKVFAGAITFSHYNILIRFVMKRIAARSGKILDTHQDYEFTTWSEVERFSDEFGHSLRIREELNFEGAPI